MSLQFDGHAISNQKLKLMSGQTRLVPLAARPYFLSETRMCNDTYGYVRIRTIRTQYVHKYVRNTYEYVRIRTQYVRLTLHVSDKAHTYFLGYIRIRTYCVRICVRIRTYLCTYSYVSLRIVRIVRTCTYRKGELPSAGVTYVFVRIRTYCVRICTY